MNRAIAVAGGVRWMMAVMSAQPLLPLLPPGRPCRWARAAAIVEDDDGGQVFVHGNLVYAWDVGDTAGRRLAAVSLIRIKAATQLQVAEAFAVQPATVRRWETQLADMGVAGLLPETKGPKRKSKLTANVVAKIQRLRQDGASYRAIIAATGVSHGSVRKCPRTCRCWRRRALRTNRFRHPTFAGAGSGGRLAGLADRQGPGSPE